MLGQTHVYYVYYGNWSIDPLAPGILNSFANSLSGSGYYNILTQYYSGGGSPSRISNPAVLGGSATSTYSAARQSDAYGHSNAGGRATGLHALGLAGFPNFGPGRHDGGLWRSP